MKSQTKFLRDRAYVEGNELSDPSYFNPLISKQKKYLKDYPGNSKGWVKLGSLYEERLSITNRIAGRNVSIRFFYLFPVLFVFLSAYFLHKTSLYIHLFKNNPWMFVSLMSVIVLGQAGLLFIRYPRSGSRSFKKAIALDPNCGEAYMYLGFIALRRFRKRKGYRLLEEALLMNVNDIRIKKELKYLYEKEFVKFFSAQKEEEKKKQDIIDNQLEQIKKLRSKQHLLETNIAILKARSKKALSKANQNIKIKAREMDSQLTDYRHQYNEKIAEIDKEKTALAENKDNDPVIYVNLNDDLFETELDEEQLIFRKAAETARSVFELELWRSLSRQTKHYLVTAEQTFSLFSRSDEIKDFSLIGLEYCKALELEINRKFVAPFVDYIKGGKEGFLKICKTGEKKNKPKYLGYLAKVVDEDNYPDINTLTLGQFYFILELSLKKDYALQQYEQFMTDLFSADSKQTISVLLEKLGIVVKRYRNAIAHQSAMNRKECEHVRELVFSGKDSLLRICAMA